MIKKVVIGEKELVVNINAGTFIRYKKQWNEDLLVALQDADASEMDQLERMQRLIYIMCGEYKRGTDFLEWLEQFDLAEFYAVANNEIIPMLFKAMGISDAEVDGKN